MIVYTVNYTNDRGEPWQEMFDNEEKAVDFLFGVADPQATIRKHRIYRWSLISEVKQFID